MAQDDRRHRLAVLGPAEARQPYRRASLLHHDRIEPHVERSRLEKTLHRGRVELRVHVVDIRLEHHAGVVLQRRPFGVRRTVQTEDAKGVGDIALPSSKPPAFDHERPRRKRPEFVRKHRREQRPRRRHALHRLSRYKDRRAFEQRARRRRRNRQKAVGALHRPRPHVQRRTDHATGREALKQHERPQDIHEAIDRPHLVKVNLLGRHAVNAPLRLGQASERRRAALLHERGKTASLDDIENVAQMPVRMMLMRRDLDPVAGQTAARAARNADVHIRHVQRRRNGSRKRRRKLLRSFKPIDHVKHRPDCHISRDAGETVEIQNAHTDPLPLRTP